jgi:hypothetical protein
MAPKDRDNQEERLARLEEMMERVHREHRRVSKIKLETRRLLEDAKRERAKRKRRSK